MSAPARPVRLTRRQALTGVATLGPVALLAACSNGDTPDEPVPSPTEQTVASAQAAAEQRLIDGYEATIATHPGLAATLTPLRDQHMAHADALGGSPGPGTATVAPSEGAAIAALVTAERQAARERIGACVEAGEPGLARLLAFIAASEASHVPVLRSLGA